MPFSKIKHATTGCYTHTEDNVFKLWIVEGGIIKYYCKIEGAEQHSGNWREMFKRDCPNEWKGERCTNKAALEWLRKFVVPIQTVANLLKENKPETLSSAA